MAISQIINSSLASGVPGKANLPTGSVLQVVNSVYAPTVISSSSSTPVASGLTLSITPTSATSKILIFFTSYGCYVPGSAQMVGFLYRNGSDVTPAGRGWFEVETGTQSLAFALSAQAYDSPASTSAQTYAVYFRSPTSSTCYLLNNGPNLGSVQLTAMEIAA